MDLSYLDRKDAPRLAYIYTSPSEKGAKYPIVMFCGGYRSDMMGTKATYLEEQCKARGQGYVRFDYRGHGASGGVFEDSTIGDWVQDAIDMFDYISENRPVLVVGSSMGGWMALLLAKHRGGAVSAVLGLAAAPDFSEDMYARLSDAQKKELEETGVAKVPNDYSDEPYHFTKAFYEEAKQHMVLSAPTKNDFPIRLIHGMQDKDVPWELAAQIQKVYQGESVDILYIDDGDHRLSRPEDLELIDREILSLSKVL